MAAMGFLSYLVLCCVLGVTLCQSDTGGFVCPKEGLYVNPYDCGSYYQCATRLSSPYVMHCAPGSNFDEDLGNCVAMNDVKCNGRPSRDSSGIQSVSTHQTNIPFSNTNLGKSVTLRLNSRQNGPLLRSDQCAEIGRQLTRYLKTLVSTYEPSCTVNSACQQNLPFFKVECQTTTGRVIV